MASPDAETAETNNYVDRLTIAPREGKRLPLLQADWIKGMFDDDFEIADFSL
jgi:hypothetical protein